MSELYIKTKEELAKSGNYTVFSSVAMSLVGIYPAIFVFFGDKSKIYETTLTTSLFFGPMILSATLSMLSLRQRERDGRREDFFDIKEKKYDENIKKEIHKIVELADKNQPDIEEKILELVAHRYEGDLMEIKNNCMFKPLDEKNRYIKHVLDLIANKKEMFLIVGMLAFCYLLYLTK